MLNIYGNNLILKYNFNVLLKIIGSYLNELLIMLKKHYYLYLIIIFFLYY